ncbi:hypothetical protein Q8F55_007894 [Vanrija albida]|uniref:HTH psq-type domain-containing protein n=1 Tax=Vanrija albida TaxID=181172 RepID=A0ABR3PUV1_9TREE
MKTEAADTPSVLSPATSSVASSTPQSKKRKAAPAKRKAAAKPKAADINGDFTPAKKAAIMERIIETGLKATNLNDLGAEFGLSHTQLRNALRSGRKGNMRDKAVAGVTAAAGASQA